MVCQEGPEFWEESFRTLGLQSSDGFSREAYKVPKPKPIHAQHGTRVGVTNLKSRASAAEFRRTLRTIEVIVWALAINGWEAMCKGAISALHTDRVRLESL